jgi:hypothetical protein
MLLSLLSDELMSGELKSDLEDLPHRIRVGKAKVSLNLPVKNDMGSSILAMI